MANIQPRFRKVPTLLALVLAGYADALDSGRPLEESRTLLESMRRETQLAYTVAEQAAHDCDTAIRSLRMGTEEANDRFHKARERALNRLIDSVLAEAGMQPQPQPQPQPRTCILVKRRIVRDRVRD